MSTLETSRGSTTVQASRINWLAVRRTTISVLLSLFTTLLALGFMFPFLWSMSSSLKGPFEVTAYPPRLLPKVPRWGNYVEAWTTTSFGLFFKNSFVVTFLSLVGQIISSVLVAYGFSRFRFPGRDVLFLVCLSGMMMPVYVTIIPLFMMFREIGWTDSLKPLIVPSYFGGAFSILVLRQFVMTIPLEFDESALIDGANRFVILTRIILPNCRPALATVAVFIFMGSWNNFFTPLIFLDSAENFTLPLGLWFLRGSLDMSLPKDHLLMAASLITTIPVLLVFAFAQQYFTEGIVMSGIKG